MCRDPEGSGCRARFQGLCKVVEVSCAPMLSCRLPYDRNEDLELRQILSRLKSRQEKWSSREDCEKTMPGASVRHSESEAGQSAMKLSLIFRVQAPADD